MNFEEFVAFKNETTAQLNAASAEAIKERFDRLFTELPELGAVCWIQGTPGFNDGDPCRFSLYIDHSGFYSKEHIEKEELDTGDIDDFPVYNGDLYAYDAVKWEQGKRVYSDDQAGKTAKIITHFLNDIGSVQDSFEQLFGDGSKILYRHDGFSVVDYDIE